VPETGPGLYHSSESHRQSLSPSESLAPHCLPDYSSNSLLHNLPREASARGRGDATDQEAHQPAEKVFISARVVPQALKRGTL
jgi:hypothetical protein